MTARMAVDDRASKECFRHHGYASAIQKASNPACSHALAMATVSCTGSMLSCSTPMLKGTVMFYLALQVYSVSDLGFKCWSAHHYPEKVRAGTCSLLIR